jgi:hypothetical protein
MGMIDTTQGYEYRALILISSAAAAYVVHDAITYTSRDAFDIPALMDD